MHIVWFFCSLVLCRPQRFFFKSLAVPLMWGDCILWHLRRELSVVNGPQVCEACKNQTLMFKNEIISENGFFQRVAKQDTKQLWSRLELAQKPASMYIHCALFNLSIFERAIKNKSAESDNKKDVHYALFSLSFFGKATRNKSAESDNRKRAHRH